jgi:rod shape-determining protein MreC
LEHFERKKRRFDNFSMQGYRLLGVTLVAGAIMFVDLRYPQWVEPVRHYALQLFEPVLRLLSYPERIYNVANDSVLSHQQLLQENKLLKSLLLQKSVQMQQVSELKAENMRLLALVESGVNLDDNFIYAQVLSASSQPQQHMILLNKGLREGIKVGYPVLDATGVMGQVVEASHRLSHVMLLADNRHAVPVRVRRTQQGAILKGMGDTQRLKVEYAAETMDIKEGDILETSGAGLYFPTGYPVAKVSDITKHTGKAFAQIYATPLAHLDSSQHVIVLFKQAAVPVNIKVMPVLPNQDLPQ